MLHEYQEHSADEYFLKSKEGEEHGVGNRLVWCSEFFRETMSSNLEIYE